MLTDIVLDNRQFYQKFIDKINNKKNIHVKAAQYYEIKSKYFTIPTILLSSITSIGSFINSSELFNNNQKLYISLIIGIIGGCSTLLQSCNNNLKLEAKAEMFRNAADQYENLITKIQFENEFPNEKDFVNKLEKEILKIQNYCKYFPPDFLLDEN